ncbi:MAG: acyl-CoA/acyl-ACP dehydrogenase [Frankiaceae bacterium]|nr:acyl-CoA/acyl-ACP dehydrogenase [Frankiaceae bacterium]MBV9871050.1 acyl-CoA/acyl-ACP dehydrogenase [Frankiaceae bacterium]
MNLSLDETQNDLAGLAAQIMAGRGKPEQIEATEATEDAFDRDLWRELAEAGLLGVSIPEEYGGLGFGSVELGLVCEQLGRVVAPIPLVATGAAAQLIAACGTDEQRQRWLPGIAAGSVVMAVAAPQSVVELVANGDTASGVVVGVAWAHVADAVLIPHNGSVLALDPKAAGVTAERAVTTGREVALTLTLDNAATDRIGDSGAAAVLQQRWLTALAATQAGVTDGALRMAASYTSTREQFEKPLSTFQSVALKAADGYLDTTAIQFAARQAAWTLDQGLDATLAVLTAAWWAAEGGQHCVHITQHLHGGMGADVTYPVHRYFLWGKQIEMLTGGASALLAELGDALVDRPDAGDSITV